MSNHLSKKIEKIKDKLTRSLNEATNIKILENIRINFLGKKGLITTLMSELKNLSIEDKKKFGPLINKLKSKVEEQIKKTKENLIKKQTKAKISKKENFDVTAYKTNQLNGHLHILSQFTQEVEDIFISMGFEIFEGPQVETDFYNFTALNIPQDHPARDMYDTFWLNKKNMLMRTHTSPAQIHAMQNTKPPIAGIVTGTTFRHEAVDASHDIQFMQCEGIYIDKNVTLANLFAVTKKFLEKLFNKKDLDIRIRPGYFPFVEPGVEIDMKCPFCKNGCSICKKTTWIEVFPGGLIHPNVLKFGKIDPEKYSGFAFGFGLTRLVMLKHNINDVRLLHSGKIKFLEQF
ncbi:phenylalanine--tRNA ligase subunit alpha [Candidatus Dependentiae bacterium]|nr:phenylalanine--tRNA ligase subunit alpha [Candidatus Dependentiae bacterium]